MEGLNFTYTYDRIDTQYTHTDTAVNDSIHVCTPQNPAVHYVEVHAHCVESGETQELSNNPSYSLAEITHTITPVVQYDANVTVTEKVTIHDCAPEKYLNVNQLRKDPDVDMDELFYCLNCHRDLDGLAMSQFAECRQCCEFHLCKHCCTILHDFCAICLEQTMVPADSHNT